MLLPIPRRILSDQEEQNSSQSIRPNRPPEANRPPSGKLHNVPRERRTTDLGNHIHRRVDGVCLTALMNEEDVGDNAASEDLDCSAEEAGDEA